MKPVGTLTDEERRVLVEHRIERAKEARRRCSRCFYASATHQYGESLLLCHVLYGIGTCSFRRVYVVQAQTNAWVV